MMAIAAIGDPRYYQQRAREILEKIEIFDLNEVRQAIRLLALSIAETELKRTITKESNDY